MNLMRHRVILALIVSLVAGGVVRGAAADYDREVAAGKALIESGAHAEAFQKLQGAVTGDPTRFEAYFELAIVSYRMGNIRAAEEFAGLALERAPDGEKVRIKEMGDVIREKRAFEELERGGDEAYGGGLMAKAADLYRKAYLLFPNQGRVGLRAAQIYAETMGRLLDAAVLWQKIAAQADEPSRAAAREELSQRREELDRLAATQLASAMQARDTARLLQLTEAFPQKLEPRLELAAAFAVKNDATNATRHLAEANKLGLKASVVAGRAEFLTLLTNKEAAPKFAQFLTDAFGAEVASGMQTESARRAREAEAREKDLAPWREPTGKNQRIADLGLDLIWITSGSFTLGSATSASPDEKPELKVSLTGALWLGKTEVTQAQWQAVMGGNPSKHRGADRPVENITYDEALSFCQKLTERERRAGRLSQRYEYGLPTEAQWEYACRAGTTGDYAGTLRELGWFKDNAGGTTQPVAKLKANAWGFHDMHGNVWEWCRDWYRSDYTGYPSGTSANNPIGPSSGTERVLRGGDWSSGAEFSRSANRNKLAPGTRSPSVGLRVALRTVRK